VARCRLTDTPAHSWRLSFALLFLCVISAAVSQERIRGVRTLFRDASQTEFIIATIPTQLGIAESRRLLAALQEETIPCKRIIVNQVRLCCAFDFEGGELRGEAGWLVVGAGAPAGNTAGRDNPLQVHHR
jgi:hypothetical protein